MAKSSDPVTKLTKYVSKNPLIALGAVVAGYFAWKKWKETQATKVAGYLPTP